MKRIFAPPVAALALAAGALVLMTAPLARAIVDDAYSAAMGIAGAPVKKGFKIREDYWNGMMKSGESKVIKTQLFKGNEYWFWLGSEEEDVELALEMFDPDGTKVSVETSSGKGATGVRVVPPKTGTYIATISVVHKSHKDFKFGWALAYAYR